MNDIAAPALKAVGDVAAYMHDVGVGARVAARELARADSGRKDRALSAIAAALRRDAARLLEANARDVAAARDAKHDGAFVDRLILDAKGIDAMARGVEAIVALSDPIGEITGLRQRPSGIQVGQMRVPLG